MASLMAFLIYIGGMDAVPDTWGFWKTIGWPYYFGKGLMTALVRELDNP